jgi:hypothetical protein
MAKLGSESLKLKPKAFAVQDCFLFIGFEENIIIRYNLEDNTVRLKFNVYFDFRKKC